MIYRSENCITAVEDLNGLVESRKTLTKGAILCTGQVDPRQLQQVYPQLARGLLPLLQVSLAIQRMK